MNFNIFEYYISNNIDKIIMIDCCRLFFSRLIHPIIGLIFTLQIQNIHAQQYISKNLNTNNGLSNNTVFTIQQDKRGFIWMGTADGLNRFDGKAFKKFNTISNNNKIKGPLYVWELLVHSNGSLWLATNKGLFIFNDTTELLDPVKNVPEGVVHRMAEDQTGKVWLSLYNNLYECDPLTREAIKYPNYQNQKYTDIIVTDNHQMWVGTENGELGLWMPFERRFIFFPVSTHFQPASTRRIIRIFKKDDRTLWVGTLKGVTAFDIQQKKAQPVSLSFGESTNITVRDFQQVYPNEFWVATNKGIYILDSNGSYQNRILQSPENRNSLADDYVWWLLKDAEGGIWCATYHNGVSYYPPVSNAFEVYTANLHSSHGLWGKNFTNITEDDQGHIWIASAKGLNRFDPHTRRFEYFSQTPHQGAFSGEDLLGMVYDQGKLWLGVWLYGLQALDTRSKNIVEHYTAGTGTNDLKSNRIMSLHVDLNGKTIWVGTADGIFQFDKGTKRFTRSDHFPQQTPYNVITQTPDGTVWGLTHGLFFYNEKQNLKGEVKVMVDGKNILPTSINSALLVSRDGTIWLGTGNGLININIHTKKTYIYTSKHGLPSDIVTAIAEDNYGKLWVTTAAGIVMLDPATMALSRFEQIKEFSAGQFAYASSYKARNGDIYIATHGGIIRVNPDNIKTSTYKPPLYITEITMLNIPLTINPNKGPLKQSASLTHSITFTHKQSSFEIDFAALSYAAPDGIQYAYKMEGLDNNWYYIKDKRNVSFIAIKPGKYTFKVKATDNRGIWQDNERVLHITILNPFYATTWAYLTYVVLFFLLTYTSLKYYKRNLAERQKRNKLLYEIQREKEIYASKTEFFTHVIHEIKAPITLLKAPLEMAKIDTEDRPRTQKYLNIMEEGVQRSLNLINELLTLKKTESAQMQIQPERLELTPFLESVYFIFDPVIKQKQFAFKSIIEKGLTHIYADKEALTKIISNLLDNALKYGKSQIILKVQRSTDPDKIEISVASDGDLIIPENREKIFEPFARLNPKGNLPGTGIGLALSRSLATLHRGSLVLEVSDSYNIFILTIPQSLENK
ncbi:ligand-binding sensor domain-containing protein [Niabella digestorum]|uniref:histidine kinase n=1 Tax=Niabella digestorum TaxID=3117701 RepID=A0ABU7RGJ0_9BACT